MTQVPTDPNPTPPTPQAPNEPGLDPAQQSLSDALRVSFGVLKVLMAVLFVVYLFSGVFRVDEQNAAVRYRFGEQIGDTYGPGWHFGLPFPIEQVVMVPRNAQTVALDQSFWYDNPDDLKPEDLAYQSLDPLKDSFLITGDTNVVHVQFKVNYVIREGDVEDYLRNVGSLEKANELVKTAAERGMIHAIASTRIDAIVSSSNFPIGKIKSNTQAVLDELGAGLTVQEVLIALENQSMPNQVREAYTGVTQAQADKAKAIQDARRVYDEQLGRTAGSAHDQLLAMIRAYESALSYGHDDLAQQLIEEINRAIDQLQLPGSGTLALMDQYMRAGAAEAVGGETTGDQSFEQARLALSEALASPIEDRTLGKTISGEIAVRIGEANANRTLLRTRAQRAWEDYETALATYRKTPMVYANSQLQATRKTIFADSLVQTYIGVIPRLDTTMDPEVAEELNNAAFDRRRQQAAEERANP